MFVRTGSIPFEKMYFYLFILIFPYLYYLHINVTWPCVLLLDFMRASAAHKTFGIKAKFASLCFSFLNEDFYSIRTN